MARRITHTLTVEGRLVALTPLHVGAADEGPVTDMAMAVDGRGRYYVPGTSLAGAIRAFCKVADSDVYWGFAAGEDIGNASHVIVDDAPALDPPLAELWHGNGIDRARGTAADGIKYDREVLPRGTALALRLALEVGDGHDLDERRGFLAWLLERLEGGELPLGAASTRGLGQVRLVDARCTERDWSTPAGILDWLADADGEDRRAAWQAQLGRFDTVQRDRLRIEVHWRPTGPLMSRAARDGVCVDAMPFVSRRDDGKLALALPGAGIKGAWRGQAERIVRTVLGPSELPARHQDQVDVSLVRDLFGLARPADTASASQARTTAGKGRLGFATCYARFALPAEDWDALEREPARWQGPPDQGLPMSMAMHVAIDRWTGGAAESLLYSGVEPMGIDWDPLVLRLDTGGQPLAGLALLWLTLRDFCAGRIPLGQGVNRGFGDLAVERVVITGLGALGQADDRVELAVGNGVLDDEPVRELRTALADAWTAWIENENKGGRQ